MNDSVSRCTHRMCVYKCVHRAYAGGMHPCTRTEPPRTSLGMPVHTCTNTGLYLLLLGRCMLVCTGMCGPLRGGYTCKHTHSPQGFNVHEQLTHLSVSRCACMCTQRAHREVSFSEQAGDLGMLPSLLISPPIQQSGHPLPLARSLPLKALGILPFRLGTAQRSPP